MIREACCTCRGRSAGGPRCGGSVLRLGQVDAEELPAKQKWRLAGELARLLASGAPQCERPRNTCLRQLARVADHTRAW